MTTATVAPPTGNQFGVLLAIFLVITFITCVVLWRTISRHGREISALKRRTGRGESRLKKLADHLKVDIYDDRDDSPAALAKAAPDDDTDSFPVIKPEGEPTAPMALVVNPTPAVQARRDAAWDQQRPSPVPRDLSGEFPHPVDSDERKAQNAADIEERLKQFNFTGRDR